MPSGTTARKTVPLLERRKIISLVREAVANGAWKSQACRCIGISIRTLQRWTNGNVITTDRKSDTITALPKISCQKRKNYKYWSYATLQSLHPYLQM